MNLSILLDDWAERAPERAALVESRPRRRVVSYRELAERVRGFSGEFRAAGLQPGDGVVILHPVGIGFYEILLAAWRAGLVAVIVDPSRGPDFVNRCCQRLRPKALVVSPLAGWLRMLYPALRRIPVVWQAGGWSPRVRRWVPAKGVEAEAVESTHPALVTFTSGTTGGPKAAVRSQGFLLAQHRALASSISLREGEVDLITLPVFAIANLASGLTSVIADMDLRHPARVQAERIIAQVAVERVTRCAASPALFQALLRGKAFPAFQAIYTGGAPVFPSLLRALREARPEMSVYSVYGSTEAEPMAHVEEGEIEERDWERMREGRGLLVGKPVPEVRLAIVEDRGGQPLAAMTKGEFARLVRGRGEIVVAGDHVLQGYLDGVGDEETKFRVDGETWHRTGDAGVLDERGRLWLLGRLSAGVEVEGRYWYPFEVEVRVDGLEGVARSAFVEIGGRRWVFVETMAGASLCEGQVRAVLGEVPVDEVRLVKRIPVDNRHEAKVDYVKLRRWPGM
ncbi:MAG: AMP-binding protein [Verrucomicrobiota bacterium]